MTYRELCWRLENVYDRGEARAVAQLLLDDGFGLSLADVLSDGVDRLPPASQAALEQLANRLEQGEPVQYVLGHASYCGRRFMVAPGVLIPRPETQQLNALIASHCGALHRPCRILDIGTGSGCIAVTAALDGASQWQVMAWDVSERALDIAGQNARRLGASVTFVRQDALQPPDDRCCWDVIVSNPPYICAGEQAAMHRNVVAYEPPEALFVPDGDPQRFYRAIGRYALHALCPGGRLLFEVSALRAADTAALLRQQGFSAVSVVADDFGRDRFVTAALPPSNH